VAASVALLVLAQTVESTAFQAMTMGIVVCA
jgi:hypothetical protein